MATKTDIYSPEPGLSTVTWSIISRVELPSPSQVRSLKSNPGGIYADNFSRATPVRFPSLGHLVKYGGAVTVGEAETQVLIGEKLRDKVRIPEVFDWTFDGGQGFIYMELVEGDTLDARWQDLDESSRLSICAQLRYMVDFWRQLRQDDGECFIGW